MSAPRNERPTALEHANLRAYLRRKGLSQADIDALAGTTPTRTRGDIARRLTGHFQSLRK
jgi:hypothetical protein